MFSSTYDMEGETSADCIQAPTGFVQVSVNLLGAKDIQSAKLNKIWDTLELHVLNYLVVS